MVTDATISDADVRNVGTLFRGIEVRLLDVLEPRRSMSWAALGLELHDSTQTRYYSREKPERAGPRFGQVHFNSWAGRSAKRVEILAETPKNYRVRLLEDAVGRKSGDVFLAPKHAVTLEPETPQASRGGPKGPRHTVESLTAALRRALKPLHDLGEPLLAAPWFHVVSDATGAPDLLEASGLSGEVKGWYNPNSGQVYLRADALARDTSDAALRGLVLHEIGVHLRHLGQSGKAWDNLLKQFDAMEQAGDKAVGAAYRRAMLAGPAQGRLHEEALAYYIEAHPDLPFARKVLAWLRMMLRKLGETFEGLNRTRWMRWANTLTTDDLVAMARGALVGSVRDSGLRRNALSKRSFSAASSAEDERLRDLLKTYANEKGAPSEAEIAEAVRQYREVERQNAEALRAHDEDGKPLPAPNGKPSKLNREQWVLVRTPNFKRWFGDWEQQAHQQRIDRLPVVNVDWDPGTDDLKTAHARALQEAEKRYLRDSSGNAIDARFTNRETGDVIHVSKTGLRKSISGHSGMQKMRIIPVLPGLIERSHFVMESPDELRREEIAGYRYYVGKADLGGKTYYVKLAVRDLIDGTGRKKKFYDHELSSVSETAGERSPTLARQAPDFPATVSLDHIRHHGWMKFNGTVSQVTDANGEPLVVYHGTDADFAQFSLRRLGKATSDIGAGASRIGPFFTDDAGYASDYARHAAFGYGGDNLMPAFLNMRKPYKANESVFHRRAEQSGGAQALKRELRDAGHDSAMLSVAGGAHEAVVFDPRQIKSATGNVGTFDARKADIRFSRSTPDSAGTGAGWPVSGLELSGTPEGVFAEIDRVTASQGPWQREAGNVRDRWESLKGVAKRHWLGALSVRQLAEVGKELLPGMTEYVDHMQGMAATRTQVFDLADQIAKDWGVLVPGDKGRNRIEQNRLAAVMHEATIAGVDPAEDYRPSIDIADAAKQIRILQTQMLQRPGESQAGRMEEVRTLRQRIAFERKRLAAYEPLRKRYLALTAQSQDIYRRARDFHVAQSRRVEQALIEMIEQSQLRGKAKAEAIAKLRKEFEAHRVQAPYFPLARQGDYWVVLKPEDDGPHEFHMFQTVEQQERFIEEQSKAGGRIVGRGKQLENLREVVGVSPNFVEAVEQVMAGIGKDPIVESARDQVYQLYLATLPELSVRKHFIHRKKTPGFGQDALRAFAEKAYHDAYQYARLKHGLALRGTMEDLRGDVEAANRPGQLRQARAERDREAVVETNAAIQAFNEANPRRRILGTDIAQSIRMRARNRSRAESGALYNPRLRRELVERYQFAAR